MKQRQLLTSGLQVGEIALGCMSFSGFYGPTTEAEAHEALAMARDLGVDHLDTSNVYGMGVSERFIGSFLKDNQHDFKIATKAAITKNAETGERMHRNDAAHLREELEGSLKRLGVEQVELFYIHRRDTSLEIEEVMETLLALKAEGKIGGIGFSEISPASLRRACAVGPVDAVQSEYSMWTRLPEMGLVQACEELGVCLIAFSPLGRGMLTDVAPNPAAFAPTDFRLNNPRFMEPNFSYNMEQVAKFKAYAADQGTTTGALALAWCLKKSPNIIPIPGTRTAKHLTECASASDLVITDQMMAEMEAILPIGWAHGDRYSRGQWWGPEGYC